jgi:hypothetical protein
MLINLSNHPVKLWSEQQVNYANKLYGEITNLNFPKIPPDADEANILKLADQYMLKCKKLISRSSDNKNAVHLMGEMTFSFALVSLLLKNNILCVASTTNRSTTDNGDLTKTTFFNFVKFRKYVLYES